MAQWSAHEDEQLRKLVKEYGPKRWSIIASKLKTKGSKQCRRRWKNHLNADLKSGGWTAEEDRILMEGHRLYGNKWTEIAKMVGGRTDNAVKNRYAALCKRDAKGAQRGGHTRGGRGGRKPRTSDSDGGASEVEMDDDSDDNEDAKRTSSSSVSREASPVRHHTRSHSAAGAAERATANSTPPPQRGGPSTAPSPQVPKGVETTTGSENEPQPSTGVRSSFLGRRRQPGGGGGSPPLQPEPEAQVPAKRRALMQSGGGMAVAGGSDRPPIATPQTPLVQVPQMQHQPQEALIPTYQHPRQHQHQRFGLGGRSGSSAGGGAQASGGEALAVQAAAPPPPPQQQAQQQEAMRRSSSGGKEAEIMASLQPKKMPLTINIPNAASAEPQAVQQPTSAAASYGIEIRVLKDLLTPCEIQYARELNDMQLPLHINVDEDAAGMGPRSSGSLLGLVSEPPLTTSRQAAQNALTSLFSPGCVTGGSASDFNDVLKWFQTGFTPRSSCGDDMTPRLMSRMGLTPCGLSGSRGGVHCVDEVGMLGTGLTPKCLLDSGSPRSHSSGIGGGLIPHMPELSAAKRARRQVEVAAAVAAAASELPALQQQQQMVETGLGPLCGVGSRSGSGTIGNSNGGGCSGSAAAGALGMMSPGGMELHAGHRQLLTKLIQTAAAADANGQGASSSGGAGDVDSGSRHRLALTSPSGGMVTPEPLTGRSSLTRNLGGAGTMGQATATGDCTGSSNQVLNGAGVVVMPYFTQQELMLLLEVLNSEDLQALPPPPGQQ
ncbi:hypothetical protein Vretimale_133 [Volvox reticuliferus]|uniref:Uncharacterized protein n=1 Tax=Volvox reticuliferus TaxID=1737510 RepID=A0A8J4FJG3_9CHLO|nr:hypothetical protein Vretifemale_8267 [Volvox reticuliferus]GIL93907.1 hypothetical protein Vretimale_133 [Volvox reticuliferus]